ncbi:MAG: YggT family protein [Sphingomonadales bacterium]
MLTTLLAGIRDIGATLLYFYIWVIVIGAVMSWLIAFNVINAYQPFVRQVMSFLWAITEPVLKPIRRWIPLLGGVDISPIILILVLQFLAIPLWVQAFNHLIALI